MKQTACIYLFLALLLPAAHSVRAEVIFFDDSQSQTMVAPTTLRNLLGIDRRARCALRGGQFQRRIRVGIPRGPWTRIDARHRPQ
jgi:hypothetical protein